MEARSTLLGNQSNRHNVWLYVNLEREAVVSLTFCLILPFPPPSSGLSSVVPSSHVCLWFDDPHIVLGLSESFWCCFIHLATLALTAKYNLAN